MYTIKQVAELAHITVRTLHYYDEIGLLKPAKVGSNGYRYYDEAALLRLQQILFYRELDMELLQIKDLLDNPQFDLLKALQTHREALNLKLQHMHQLIHTVDNTIQHLAGDKIMSNKGLFEGFSAEKQKEYEREARLEYGPEHVNTSIRRWNSYTSEKKDAIMQEASEIYQDLVKAMQAGIAPQSSEIAPILDRWQENIRYFYEPTLEILRGLGELYNTSPDFMATFSKFHPDLAPYLQASITHYVDELETAEIERMLAEDQAVRSQRLGMGGN